MSYEELHDKEVKCRKPNKCGWCAEEINTGEKARSRKYKWEGEFVSEYQHIECYDAMQNSGLYIEDGYEFGQFGRGQTAQEREKQDID